MAAPASADRQEQELSPRQNATSSMEHAIQSLGSMEDRLESLDIEPLDLRADPDAQATVTDFLDFTEYLPADMTRSLTLIGKLDQTYIDASTDVHHLTKQWGQLPNISPEERPQPVQLRAEISKRLSHVMSSRTYAHAEAVRMAENATRHYNRAKTILSKLQTMLENYPTAEEQKSPVATAKTAQASRTSKLTMRVNDGRKVRGRRVPRITVPGEVLPPYEVDYAAYSSSESSSEEDEDDDETPPARATPAPQPRIKIVKNSKPPKTPKVPKASGTSVPPPSVPRAGPSQPAPPLASLKPPPEDAVIGSSDAPWLQLTAWELARLRKRMKKNAQWSPSDTMIARELKALGRGPEAYKNAKQLAEEQGKPFEPMVPALVADADGVEHPPMGALSLDAALAAEDKQTNNRGLKLNVAKKLKKENLARLAAEEAEESARKMRETVNALLNPIPMATGREKPSDKSSVEASGSKNARKYGGRKRKRDSVPEAEAEKPGSMETPSQAAKRTKTETPVPLPQQAPSGSGAAQETPIQPLQPSNAHSTTPIPVPVTAQEQVVAATSKSSSSNSPLEAAPTVTTTVPVKPPADLTVPPQSPKKSTTPILPPVPVRETRKSQSGKKEQQQQKDSQPSGPAPAAPSKPASRPSTPGAGAISSSRPTSRGKTGSQEPPQSLASDRPRRASTARNTPAPEPRQQGKQRGKRPVPGVVSRNNSGGSSAVGRRKAAPKKKAARAQPKKEKGQQVEVDVEIEVDDEGNVIDPDEERYCLCNRVSFGTMIQCENVENCKYEWFHLECVDMAREPARTTKWYCPSCRVILNIGEKGEVNARGVKM